MAACPVGRVPPDMRKDGYFMKSMKRRLLSLFMAMVMVCSLVPGALAEDASLTLSQASISLKMGGTETASLSYSSGLPTGVEASSLTWESSDSTVASYNNGTVTAHKAGNATITASYTATTGEGDNQTTTTYKGSCTVTVEAADPVTSTVSKVTLSPSSLTFEVGKSTAQIVTATVEGTNLADADKYVEWALAPNDCVELADSSNTSTKVQLKSSVTTAPATTQTVKLTATSKKDTTIKAECTITIKAAEAPTATITGVGTMKLGGIQNVTLTTTAVGTVTWKSTDENILTVTANSNGTNTATVTALKEGSAKIYAMIGSVKSNELTIAVEKPVTISVSGNNSTTSTSNTLVGMNSRLDLNVGLNVASGSTTAIKSVAWSLDSKNVVTLGNTTGNSVAVYANSVGTTTVTATVYLTNNQTATVTQPITVKSGANYSIGASVYVESSGYSLGDEDDKGKDSIIEQIDAKLGSSRYCKYVWFDTTSHTKGDLDAYKSGSGHPTNDRYDADDAADVVFTPDSSAKVGDVATFTLTVEDDKGTVYTFEVSFTLIEGTSAGDITYSAALGEDVYFDVSDFEDFYNDKYSSGYLEYVTFGSSSSNGTLYNEDGKTAGSSSYYVDPSKSSQKSLDGIYFSPKSSMKRSTTVKISFTARGTKRNDTGTGEVSGTVTIFYLNDSASDIVYNTTAGKVTLDPKDFNEAYKQATGSKTAPSNLTIEFQNVPSNGTLTYTGGSKDKDLTKSNVKSNRYTTKSSGTYRLAQLTYTGTRGKDTIDYIAYSGGTAQFSGKVVFNGTAAVPTDVVVTYGSTGGQAVRFSQNDFVSANSAMSKATKVRFVAPANGTLLMNGANASGVDIATTLLGTVTYQPKSGFNGQDKIIFAAYDASNNTVASGTVNITVIGNPTTGTTPGGTPGGVSDVSQFKDVSATAWYRDNLATLVRKGIITGKGDGKFDPLGTVTYGEALKMVLESCGYTAALGTGSNWAINYKNLAVSRGWISSDIDLNAAISRNATAELTAKVLGVSAVTSGSPFADEANGYAAALYYTSPQIFAGSPNPNGGKPLFKNSSPLLRQEVCAVICRVSDYHAQHTTNNMPDGI